MLYRYVCKVCWDIYCVGGEMTLYTMCDQKVPRLIFLLGCGTLQDTPVCRVVSYNSLSPWDKEWSQRASQPFVSFGRRESCTSALLLFVPCGMSEEQEQRVCINFCVKLERNGAERF